MTNTSHEMQRRLNIPAALGKQADDFFENNSRYIDLYVEDNSIVFAPTENKTAVTAPGYALQSRNDFENWRDVAAERIYTGYLVGFPDLHSAGAKIPTLHFWENNSDIFQQTLAVPLNVVQGLLIYSKFCTQISQELDELGMGDTHSRYEIPILHKKGTSEMYYRDATFKDLEVILDDEQPAQVYKAQEFTIPFPPDIKYIGAEALQHIFDV